MVCTILGRRSRHRRKKPKYGDIAPYEILGYFNGEYLEYQSYHELILLPIPL
jgi:hypothetical protein